MPLSSSTGKIIQLQLPIYMQKWNHKKQPVSAKIVMKEIQKLCLLKDKSAFRELNEGVRKFNWDILWLELAHKAPTLLQFYRQLFRGAPKALICFAISLIIKWRSPKWDWCNELYPQYCMVMVLINR